MDLGRAPDAAPADIRNKPVVAITSTFTCEPVKPALAFWMRELRIDAEIDFAPYNQVFQQLLDPTSLVSRNSNGFDIVILRLTDWQGFEQKASEVAAQEEIERNVRKLIETLQSAVTHSQVPILICLCPPEQKVLNDRGWTGFFSRMEHLLAYDLSTITGIDVLTTGQILDSYPVDSFADEYADQLGHVPYTPAFFVALATMLARRIHFLRSSQHKVIVLDCDNTLWAGLCGEDGPRGVCIDGPRRFLQEFMLKQIDFGMLLCLCSKNADEDVDAVFARNSGMLLKGKHFAARRVNWNSKSQNLQELAKELRVGLDSFIFLDDNVIEIAEVQAHCPEVLALHLPRDAEQIPRFLRNVWPLDHWKVTPQDAKRTETYRQDNEREKFRKSTSTLDEFLAGLELRLDFHSMRDSELARVSQLSDRTTQFNFTKLRCREPEVRQFLLNGGDCLVVSVSDRFGDYGVVGAILYSANESELTVDNLLLSCRALGRKVEHRMLSRLGHIAKQRHLSRVLARFIPTRKNQPALDFLNSVGSQFCRAVEGHFLFDFPADYAADVHLRAISVAEPRPIEVEESTIASAPNIERQNRTLARIAAELHEVSGISHAMEVERMARQGRDECHVNGAATLIGLGEIEARLREHAGVGDAVVVAREDAAGKSQLVAYYTCAGRSKTVDGASKMIRPEELRAYLTDRLPAYMVPKTYVRLEEMTPGPDGILDLKALPIPNEETVASDGDSARPLTAVEETLARIWAEVLGVDRVGTYDNFFELGGDSIAMIQIISRLRAALNVEIPIETFFDGPTIVDLTVAIAAELFETTKTQEISLDRLPERITEILEDEC